MITKKVLVKSALMFIKGVSKNIKPVVHSFACIQLYSGRTFLMITPKLVFKRNEGDVQQCRRDFIRRLRGSDSMWFVKVSFWPNVIQMLCLMSHTRFNFQSREPDTLHNMACLANNLLVPLQPKETGLLSSASTLHFSSANRRSVTSTPSSHFKDDQRAWLSCMWIKCN